MGYLQWKFKWNKQIKGEMEADTEKDWQKKSNG